MVFPKKFVYGHSMVPDSANFAKHDLFLVPSYTLDEDPLYFAWHHFGSVWLKMGRMAENEGVLT